MTTPKARSVATPLVITGAALLDFALITVFSFQGRLSHGHSVEGLQVFATAWPFLLGALLGWIACRVWRFPSAVLNGVWVWLSTIGVGFLLRWVTNAGVAPAFLLVATGMLLLFLVGWRLIAAAFRMLSREPRSD